MMPASTNSKPAECTRAATSWTIAGLTALQSMKSGRCAPRPGQAEICSASASATPGGTIESSRSARRSSRSGTSRIPAAAARSRVAALRPASVVSTSRPLSASRRATADPMLPGAMIATTGFTHALPRRGSPAGRYSPDELGGERERLRSSDRVALNVVDAHAARGVECGGVLDLLGDHFEVERAGELDHRGDHRLVHRVARQIAHEGSVDLQEVHRQILEIRERADAGA